MRYGYNMVRLGTVRYDTGMVWYGKIMAVLTCAVPIACGTATCEMVRCGTLDCGTVRVVNNDLIRVKAMWVLKNGVVTLRVRKSHLLFRVHCACKPFV